jgi:hypothetical protein
MKHHLAPRDIPTHIPLRGRRSLRSLAHGYQAVYPTGKDKFLIENSPILAAKPFFGGMHKDVEKNPNIF